jgi:hypothetical protein
MTSPPASPSASVEALSQSYFQNSITIEAIKRPQNSLPCTAEAENYSLLQLHSHLP